jgi:hypothetical protein
MPQRSSQTNISGANSQQSDHQLSNNSASSSSFNNVNLNLNDSAILNEKSKSDLLAKAKNDSSSRLNHLNKFIKEEFDEFRHAIENDMDDNYHNKIESRNNNENQSIVIERQGGLQNRFVLFLLFLWYLFSAFTLYTNKYIVTTRKANPTIIGILF